MIAAIRTVSLAAVAVFISIEAFAEERKPLLLYAGAGIREPVTELAGKFTARTGRTVEIIFNNSGGLLAQLQVAKKGDLFMPGSMPFIEKARAAGLISAQSRVLAYHVPAIIVPKANPARIAVLKDMARPGVRVVLPDREATALGKTAVRIFTKAGVWDGVSANVLTTAETPQKVIALLLMGQGDAGIADASNVLKHADRLMVIPIDPSVNESDPLVCAGLTVTDDPAAVKAFMDFIAAQGTAVFRAYGYHTAP
jgi:molybdate transport system substrate-binding protein